MKIVWLFLSLGSLIQDPVQAQKTYEVSWLDYGDGMLPKRTKRIAYWQVYNTDNLLVEQRYSPQEDAEKKTVYRYNHKKKLVATEEHPPGSSFLVKNCTYDSSGSLTSASWQRRNKKDDSIVHHETYRYDEEGRLSYKELETLRNGRLASTEGWKYNYERKDREIKMTETYFVDGRKKRRLKYEIYNDKGLMVYTRDGYHITKYTYQYDAAGDWIVQKVCVKDGDIGSWRCEGEYQRVLK